MAIMMAPEPLEFGASRVSAERAVNGLARLFQPILTAKR
jgi:hypothetical protein